MESASASTSVLVYATQMGGIRSWDLRYCHGIHYGIHFQFFCQLAARLRAPPHPLRDSKEPWKVQTPPELGVVTSVAVGSDKICLCVGTSRGFLTMYVVDI